jgi:hypothetical protein
VALGDFGRSKSGAFSGWVFQCSGLPRELALRPSQTDGFSQGNTDEDVGLTWRTPDAALRVEIALRNRQR